MNKLKVIINGESYTQSSALEKEKELKEKYWDAENEYGIEVTPKNNDYFFLHELTKLHPDSREKIGTGIELFIVSRPEKHPNSKCWHIKQVDNDDYESISFKNCFRNVWQLNQHNCRELIRPQIEAWRINFIETNTEEPKYFTSEFSGNRFPINELEIDHYPTFKSLVETFFNLKGIDPHKDRLPVESYPDWEKFHKENCSLRAVTIRENRSDIPNCGN
jgi:hypothetical protein